ncbi:MAG TPA: Calx-beta domain-containing protein, partial [Flavobacterium sp.]|nr:Calx-beta domain-containing protein [Flavobacterium sp.]
LKTYANTAKVVEGKSYNYSFYLTNPYSADVVINFTSTDVTTDASDYPAISKTITIPKGQTSTNFSIATTSDNITEIDETFTLTGTVTSGNTTNPNLISTITIIDDDTLPTLIINSNQGYEGQSAYNSIILSRPYNANVVVKLSTNNGTADNSDYTSIKDVTRTVLAGNTSAENLQVSITDDILDEPIENFTLTGTVTSGNTTNTTASSLIEIIDNDGLPDLIISSYSNATSGVNNKVEEGQKAKINVRLSQVSDVPTIVELTTSNGTADESDYTPLTKTITIPPGITYYNEEIIEIPTILDTTQELTETFTVIGTVTSGNTFSPSTTETISIQDNYSINAQNDSPISYYKVGATFNVLENDTNQGIAINANDVNVTLSPNSDGITLNSEGIITIPETLPIGYYNLSYTICEKTNTNNCDTASINVNVSSPLDATYTTTYTDYNGDGYTSAGDIITYKFKITNKGNDVLSNITYQFTPNTTQKDLKLFGELIASLNPGESNDTTFYATRIITQNDINFGGYMNEPGVGGGSFNTYVAFKGVYYNNTVTGNAKAADSFKLKKSDGIKLNAFIDSNANGKQDSGEILFPKGKFNYEINNDGKVHVLYSNPFYLYESNPTTSYDLTYQINEEYAAYFSCTTSHLNVTVAQDSGITTYNFPITEIPYLDLAVKVINNGAPPRPGFKYYNSIAYTNNTSKTIPSGTVTFTKDSAVSILEISEPSATLTDSGFTYNFSNLLPFQTRYISVKMQVPTIPTVSLGQLVTNSASIDLSMNDIHPENNTSTLTQTIVGSYDPNDKAESHGEKVVRGTFDENEFLTYTIRFENTGTASAINIRVNDVLDAQLDANTVRMVDASHPYELERIDNILTWNFFGVDLPPSIKDDPITGHGYIVFNVKPKAGFSLGDKIPNKAEIYFDFNPAIVTNTWTTEFVSLLGVNQIENSEFVLYPNPVQNSFSISLKNNADSINSIRVFDVLGKTVISKNINQQKADIEISTLTKGIYFVQVKTNGSENTFKIIKE